MHAPPPKKRFRLNAGWIGFALLVLVALPCVVTIPWALHRYDVQRLTSGLVLAAPTLGEPMGTDALGRSLMWRCFLGGAISLGIGVASAVISVVIGVVWGGVAGYLGGRVDAVMMRIVDILYGLPYILLVVLVNLALRPTMQKVALMCFSAEASSSIGNILTLLIAIGGLSWLTMARVIRGQVLSIRAQPFIEAARALGFSSPRIFLVHILPNLVGPIIVYTTLTIPSAILQESFLSFLGIGVQPPLPSWGNLASTGLEQIHTFANNLSGSGHSRSVIAIPVRWWLMFWPSALLGVTLLALNFLGDALRERLDPRRLKT